jgi:hypothetical protein
MRRILSIALPLAALGVAALFLSPAPVGGQEGEPFATFEVIKDVHGEGPSSGFVVDYTCVDEEGTVVQSGTLNFDNLVDGDEIQEVDLSGQATCSIEETNANGADLVEYECEFFPGSVDANGGEGAVGGCQDSQTADFTNGGDFGSFLVRNTFEPDVLPDDDEPPVVSPDVVPATPPFTG